MFKITIFVMLFSLSLWGGLLDFQTLEKAEKSYKAGDYNTSAVAYESLEKQNDALHYNLGNAYYKEKHYDEAIKEFQQVNQEDLKAKALHNLGNAYAQTQKVKEAIKAYEEALKIGDDEDTKFNLELLKKEQEKQEKQKKQDQDKQDQENKDQDKKDQEKSDQEKSDQEKSDKDQKSQESDENKKSDEDQESKEDQQKKSDQEQKEKEKEEKEADEADKASQKEEEKQVEEQPMQEGEAKQAPISDMQERKYEQMLDKRGIKTLMVPIKTEGGSDEEKSAW